MKEIKIEKINNYRKIQTKPKKSDENNNEDNIRFINSNRFNSLAYTKKNQSYSKSNKHRLSLNNNFRFTNIIPDKTNIYNTNISKKYSENNLKNCNLIFKPISKNTFNSQNTIIKPKNIITNSSKGLNYDTNSISALHNINNINKNFSKINSRTFRNLFMNKDIKEKRINFTNNYNAKLNNTETNINYEIKNNMINNNFNYNIIKSTPNKINNKKGTQKNLIIKNNISLPHTIIAEKNVSDTFNLRIKRGMNSKERKTWKQKSLRNSTLKINYQVNSSSNNISIKRAKLQENLV